MSFDSGFESWCRQTLSASPLPEAARLLERAADLYLIRLYRELDLAALLKEPRTAEDIVAALDLVASADIAIEAMLDRLARRTDGVALSNGEPVRYRAGAAFVDPTPELAETSAAMASFGDDFAASLRFLDFGATHFIEALRDDPDFMDRLLSGREPAFATLWDQATNLDPLQDLHGAMGAVFISRHLEGGRILEIGGGTGNGTRHVLNQFAEQNMLGDIQGYTFTDISTAFILGTRKRIKAAFPTAPMTWQFADINKPLPAQGIEPASHDLVFGVNAAHVARDIIGFLKSCHAVLKPGGRVVFAERVRTDTRMMAPRELTLNLSIYHRTAAYLDPKLRPIHCYLGRKNWHRVLDAAGFAEIAVLPDFEDDERLHPMRYAAVITARRA